MSDNDTIRRGDALKIVAAADSRTIIAIDALPAVSVGVKPLEWAQDPTWPDAYDAESQVGRYSIGRYEKGLFSCHVEPQMRDVGLNFRSVQDAMLAAQADYEARIRAALTPAPGVDVKGLVEAATGVMARLVVAFPDAETYPPTARLAAALAAFEKENGK